jgi:hypothetical protein
MWRVDSRRQRQVNHRLRLRNTHVKGLCIHTSNMQKERNVRHKLARLTHIRVFLFAELVLSRHRQGLRQRHPVLPLQ